MKLIIDPDNNKPIRKITDEQEINSNYERLMILYSITNSQEYRIWLSIGEPEKHPDFALFNVRRCWDEYNTMATDGWQDVMAKKIPFANQVTNINTWSEFDIETPGLYNEDFEVTNPRLYNLWSMSLHFSTICSFWLSQEQYDLLDNALPFKEKDLSFSNDELDEFIG